MSSQLQKLAAAIRGLADEAGQPMQVLLHLEQKARSLAAQADALGDRGTDVAGRLSELQSSLGGIAESMSDVRSDANRFAEFLAHGGGLSGTGSSRGVGLGGSGNSAPVTVSSLPRGADGRPKYADSRTQMSPNARQWEKYPDEFVPPQPQDWADVPQDMLPFISPEQYLSWVNDGGVNVPGRNVNCADCTRAVLSNHFGKPQVAAARASASGNPPTGESISQICSWKPGMQLTSTDFASIGKRLEELGPGSAAYVGVTWVRNGQRRGGHAFAAINHWGTPFAVDGQVSKWSKWPPTDQSGSMAWDPASIGDVMVQYFDSRGNLVK